MKEQVNLGCMEPGSPWGDGPEKSEPGAPNAGAAAPAPISISQGFAPMNQNTVLTGTAQMPTGQLIYLQPPSGAAKVIGTLLIIYGALQLLGLAGLFFEQVDPITGEPIDYPAAAMALDALSSLIGAGGCVAAGVLLTQYKKRGVYIAFGVIGAQFMLGMASYTLGTPDGGLGSLFGEGAALAVWAGVSAICSGFCALLVSIPLMVSNNGLE